MRDDKLVFTKEVEYGLSIGNLVTSVTSNGVKTADARYLCGS